MKKYGSYLRKDIYLMWKAQAVKENRRDYKIMEDALVKYIQEYKDDTA